MKIYQNLLLIAMLFSVASCGTVHRLAPSEWDNAHEGSHTELSLHLLLETEIEEA
jgi:hypothetical protein